MWLDEVCVSLRESALVCVSLRSLRVLLLAGKKLIIKVGRILTLQSLVSALTTDFFVRASVLCCCCLRGGTGTKSYLILGHAH